MPSEVEICNLGLTNIGGELITSLDDDVKEAKLCKLWYPNSRDATEQEGAWNFATRRIIPARLADPPTWGYTYAYQLPPDNLQVLEVFDDPTYQVPTRDRWQVEGQTLLFDRDQVWVKHITRVTDTSQFTALFVQALGYRLAADLAIPLTNSRTLKQEMFAYYQEHLSTAKNIDGTQGYNRPVRSRETVLRARSAYYGRGLKSFGSR